MSLKNALRKIASVNDMVKHSRTSDEEQKNKFLAFMGLQPKMDYDVLEMGDDTAPALNKNASLFSKLANAYAGGGDGGLYAQATVNPGSVPQVKNTAATLAKSLGKDEEKLGKMPKVDTDFTSPNLGQSSAGTFSGGGLNDMPPSVNSGTGINAAVNTGLPGTMQPSVQTIQPTPSTNK